MKRLILSLAMALSLSTTAMAIPSIGSTVTVNGAGSDYGVFNQGYAQMTIYASPSFAETVVAGAETISINGEIVSDVYCFDIFDTAFWPGTFTIQTPSIDQTKINQLNALLSNVKATDSLSSGAIQLAVWTIEYQTGISSYNPSDSSRGFYAVADSLLLVRAKTYLDNVTNGVWKMTTGDLTELVSVPSGNQNAIFFTPIVNAIPVQNTPEPDMTFMFVILMLGLVAFGRFRKA